MNIVPSNLHPSNFHLFSEAHAQVGLSDPASPDRLHAAGDTLWSSMHPDGCTVGKYMTTNCRKAAAWGTSRHHNQSIWSRLEVTRSPGTKHMSDPLQNEEELFNCEITDEALENLVRAGADKAAAYTLFFCTSLDLCPGP